MSAIAIEPARAHPVWLPDALNVQRVTGTLAVICADESSLPTVTSVRLLKTTPDRSVAPVTRPCWSKWGVNRSKKMIVPSIEVLCPSLFCHDFEIQRSFYCDVVGFVLRNNRLCPGESRHPRTASSCTPDAFRLCSGYIPDPTGVEHCLRQNKSDLSEACRSVFEQSAGPVAGRVK